MDPIFLLRGIFLFALAIFAGWYAWYFWWKAPFELAQRKGLAAGSEKDVAGIEDAYRKSIAQAIGGGALLVGLFLTAQQYFLASEVQHIEQYQKGFEALRSTDGPSHVGAIYGLEILANAKPEWRSAIMLGLSAAAVDFSHAAPQAAAMSSALRSDPTVPKMPLDADAALQVIARAPNPNGTRYPLSHGNFVGASIPEPHFNGANLDQADLSSSDLYNGQFYGANLFSAKLNGVNAAGADFSNARLVMARICKGKNYAVSDLMNGIENGAGLTSAKFYSANMEGAWLTDAEAADAKFNDARLIGAHLERSNLYQAQFVNTDLEFAHFENADVMEAKFGLHKDSSGKLAGGGVPKLSCANFDGARLDKTVFADASVASASFRGAYLKAVVFAETPVEVSMSQRWRGANFCNTEFKGHVVRNDQCAAFPAWQENVTAQACPENLPNPSDFTVRILGATAGSSGQKQVSCEE